MHTSSLRIQAPPRFRFWPTVYSHGWSDLMPFKIDKERDSISLPLRLSASQRVSMHLTDGGSVVRARVQSAKPLTLEQRRQLISTVRACFRLDDNLQPFYSVAKKHRRYQWAVEKGAGRMFRCASVFEDIVKMMCTTNCSWALTKSMTANLVGTLGEEWNGARTFPTPEALAGVSEKFVRKEIRAGYRSPFLIELAERVANGSLDVERWRDEPMPTEELFKNLRSIKGIGEYAAGNLLRLLGHYDAMAFDSWVRAEFYKKHKNGRLVSDRTIERHYEEFGSWKGLFFWLDMTKEWFLKKHPF